MIITIGIQSEPVLTYHNNHMPDLSHGPNPFYASNRPICYNKLAEITLILAEIKLLSNRILI